MLYCRLRVLFSDRERYEVFFIECMAPGSVLVSDEERSLPLYKVFATLPPSGLKMVGAQNEAPHDE
mgnify:CR=1 FL=1|jgi:hypothetical protein